MTPVAKTSRFWKYLGASLSKQTVRDILVTSALRPREAATAHHVIPQRCGFRNRSRDVISVVLTVSTLVLSALIAIPGASAAPLSGARVTHIVNDVKTVDPGKAPRPSVLNELVEGKNSVRTGINSRTELLFADMTITRLGANSHFTFNEGTREISVTQGTILLQVPKGAGGAKIRTAAVTAAITGTTVLIKAGGPLTTMTWVEGTGFLTATADRLHRRVPIRAGYQVTVSINDTTIPPLTKVNLSNLVKNSLMFAAQWSTQLDYTDINAAIAAQQKLNSAQIGTLRSGEGVLVNKKPAKPGDPIYSGDVIETGPNQAAIIDLPRAAFITIAISTRVRVGGGGGETVTTTVVFGSIETHGPVNSEGERDDGAGPPAYIAAFGFGSFPAGGNSSASGTVLSVVLPGGLVALYDSLGNFIRFQ